MINCCSSGPEGGIKVNSKIACKGLLKLSSANILSIAQELKSNKDSHASFVLLYLTYCHQFYTEFPNSSLPAVYSDVYLFELYESQIRELMRSGKQLQVEKAVQLARYFLSRVALQNERFGSDRLDNSMYYDFINELFRLITYSNHEVIRRILFDLFKSMYACFEREARLQLLLNFFKFNLSDETLNNYISAYLIYLVKEEIVECFKDESGGSFGRNNFMFGKLFAVIFKLDKAVESDLMAQSNRIIGALNLLRFLLIRDKKTNFSKIMDFVKSNAFLTELERAIKLSKSHYQLEMKNLKEAKVDSSSQKKGQNSFEIEVRNKVANEAQLDAPNEQQKIETLHNCLHTFDLIESLRIRVCELMEP